MVEYMDLDTYNELVRQAEELNMSPEAYLAVLLSDAVENIRLSEVNDFWLEEE